MSTGGGGYLLAGGAAELERLQLQARVWEPEAEAMLDRIGLAPGADASTSPAAQWAFSGRSAGA